MTDSVTVTKEYAPAKAHLETLRDNMHASVHSGGVDARTTLTEALKKDATGTPSQAAVISLLRQLAAAGNRHHVAGELGLNQGLTTVDGWQTVVTGTDEAGAGAVVHADGSIANGPLGDGPLGVPATGPADSPAAPKPRQFESVPGLDGSPKRLGK